MAKKVCKVCGVGCTGDYCYRHKPRKAIKKTTLRKKPTGKKAARNDTEYKRRGKKARTQRRRSVKQLKTDLDRVFSVYVRLRDANKHGYVTCFTSGAEIWWLKSQCGHFMSRRHNSTRWHEQNCHAQSLASNMFLAGEQYVYGVNLDKKYGTGTADMLLLLSKQEFKLTIEWLAEKIEYYRKQVEILKQQKGL